MSKHVIGITLAFVSAVALSTAFGAAGEKADLTKREEELRAAETAFAKTMADRDHAAFASFLSEEAIFSGGGVNRGREAVAAAWAGFFKGEKPPFSWKPEFVAVLDSGDLGTTQGPVFDPEGKHVGTFNSVWRREADGKWRIIFDRGCPPCGGE